MEGRGKSVVPGNLMPLFWIVHDIDGARVVRIQEGGALIFARLHAAMDGFGGTYIEAHVLDAKTAKKIPKRMIGRTLTISEVNTLLDRL